MENNIDVVSVKYEKRDFYEEAMKIIKDINLEELNALIQAEHK